jgi:hypothetical protein
MAPFDFPLGRGERREFRLEHERITEEAKRTLKEGHEAEKQLLERRKTDDYIMLFLESCLSKDELDDIIDSEPSSVIVDFVRAYFECWFTVLLHAPTALVIEDVFEVLRLEAASNSDPGLPSTSPPSSSAELPSPSSRDPSIDRALREAGSSANALVTASRASIEGVPTTHGSGGLEASIWAIPAANAALGSGASMWAATTAHAGASASTGTHANESARRRTRDRRRRWPRSSP